MKCPRCKTNKIIKHGKVKGRQRFLCKSCSYHFTVQQRGKSPELKRLAIQLYLEGLSYRAIENLLKVSNVSVLKWVREYGENLSKIKKSEGAVKVITIKDLKKLLKKKQTNMGHGWLLLGYGEDLPYSYWIPDDQN